MPSLPVSGDAENKGVDVDIACLTKPLRKDELAAALWALIWPKHDPLPHAASFRLFGRGRRR